MSGCIFSRVRIDVQKVRDYTVYKDINSKHSDFEAKTAQAGEGDDA